jgi:hypothetical protein
MPDLKTVGGSSILGSGDIATLPSGGSVGQIIKKDSSNNAAWGADVGGKVLQFGNASRSSTWSTNSYNDSTFGDIPSLSVTITPATGSKVFLTGYVVTSQSSGGYVTNLRLTRLVTGGSATAFGIGDANGSSPRSMSGFVNDGDSERVHSIPFSIIDTAPGGDGSTAITYKVQISGHTPGSTVYVNRGAYASTGSNDAPESSYTSNLIVMELGA